MGPIESKESGSLCLDGEVGFEGNTAFNGVDHQCRWLQFTIRASFLNSMKLLKGNNPSKE